MYSKRNTQIKLGTNRFTLWLILKIKFIFDGLSHSSICNKINLILGILGCNWRILITILIITLLNNLNNNNYFIKLYCTYYCYCLR